MKKHLIFIFIGMVIAPTAFAAIGFDASSSFVTSGSALTTWSWSHTVNSNTNGILVIGVSFFNAASPFVSSIIYAGQNLTLLTTNSQISSDRNEIWYLLLPPIGTANVTTTFVGNGRGAAGASSYTGVAQTNTFTSTSTAQGNSASPSVTVTSTATDFVIDNLAYGSNGNVGNAILTQGTTLQNGQDGIIYGGASSYRAATTTRTTVSWSIASQNWREIGLSLAAAAGGSNVTTTVSLAKGILSVAKGTLIIQ